MAVTINGSTGLTGVAAIDSVSSTELGYVDGVTSAIQTQLNGMSHRFITNVAFSSATSVAVDNCFSSTYENYQVVLNVTSAANGGNSMSVIGRNGSSDLTSASHYGVAHYTGSGGGAGVYWSSGALSSATLMTQSGVTTFTITPTATSWFFHGVYFDASQPRWGYNGGGAYVNNCNGFRLIAGAGSISGTIRVYGLRNS